MTSAQGRSRVDSLVQPLGFVIERTRYHDSCVQARAGRGAPELKRVLSSLKSVLRSVKSASSCLGSVSS